jgi:hypothetical protein
MNRRKLQKSQSRFNRPGQGFPLVGVDGVPFVDSQDNSSPTVQNKASNVSVLIGDTLSGI